MPINHTSKYSDLTDEQFNLIGKIVVEWANVEVLLGELLSQLLFTPTFLGRVYSDKGVSCNYSIYYFIYCMEIVKEYFCIILTHRSEPMLGDVMEDMLAGSQNVI